MKTLLLSLIAVFALTTQAQTAQPITPAASEVKLS